jgi:hypothetical protein
MLQCLDGIAHLGPTMKPANDNRRQLAASVDGVLALMKRYGMPMTREKYIALAYMGDRSPDEVDAELEANLPPQFQDWSRFFGRPLARARSIAGLSGHAKAPAPGEVVGRGQHPRPGRESTGFERPGR